jgi:hypothetical protein
MVRMGSPVGFRRGAPPPNQQLRPGPAPGLLHAWRTPNRHLPEICQKHPQQSHEHEAWQVRSGSRSRPQPARSPTRTRSSPRAGTCPVGPAIGLTSSDQRQPGWNHARPSIASPIVTISTTSFGNERVPSGCRAPHLHGAHRPPRQVALRKQVQRGGCRGRGWHAGPLAGPGTSEPHPGPVGLSGVRGPRRRRGSRPTTPSAGCRGPGWPPAHLMIPPGSGRCWRSSGRSWSGPSGP